jgi:hypothetical protein
MSREHLEAQIRSDLTRLKTASEGIEDLSRKAEAFRGVRAKKFESENRDYYLPEEGDETIVALSENHPEPRQTLYYALPTGIEQQRTTIRERAADPNTVMFIIVTAEQDNVIGTTSFFPAKPLGCYGDGGAIFTNDSEIAEKLISIRNHGQGKSKYNNIRIGLNGRLDTIQAAILLEKMKILPKELGQRNAIAKKYSQNLNQYFKCQHVPEGYGSAWAQYSVLAASTKERSICMEKLRDADIPTAIYYPKPLHLQDAFSDLNYSTGDFPVAESISQRIFSLPMHPYLSDDNMSKICDILILCKELVQ